MCSAPRPPLTQGPGLRARLRAASSRRRPGLHAANTPRPLKRRCHQFVTVLSQPKREAAPLAEPAPDLDLPAQEPGVLLRDRQAEAGPTAAASRISLVEALEQVRQVLRRNPGSLVDDLDEGASVVAADVDGYSAAPVIQSVADEIGDDALEPPRVARDHDLLSIARDLLLPATRAYRGRGARPDVDRLSVHALRAGVEAGDLHQVLDQPPQAAHVRDQELGGPARLRRHPVEVLGEERGFADERG